MYQGMLSNYQLDLRLKIWPDNQRPFFNCFLIGLRNFSALPHKYVQYFKIAAICLLVFVFVLFLFFFKYPVQIRMCNFSKLHLWEVSSKTKFYVFNYFVSSREVIDVWTLAIKLLE